MCTVKRLCGRDSKSPLLGRGCLAQGRLGFPQWVPPSRRCVKQNDEFDASYDDDDDDDYATKPAIKAQFNVRL